MPKIGNGETAESRVRAVVDNGLARIVPPPARRHGSIVSVNRNLKARRTAIVSLMAASCLLASCSTAIIGQGAAATTASRPILAPSAPPGSTGATEGSGPGTSVSTPTGDPGVQTPGPPEATIGEPIPGGAGAGVVPGGLERFYNQTLAWQGCLPFASNDFDKTTYGNPNLDCANLIVPLNYDKPDGQSVSIGVLRSKATGDTRVGTVQFNPGGPGGSGMSTVASFDGDPTVDALHKSFDLIGFDPRGIGGSRPLIICQSDEERDAARAANNRLLTPEEVAKATADLKLQAEQCGKRTGAEAGIDGAAFLASVGTDTVVKDMDVLRSVLGDEKLTYVGYSYGTRLGYVYADQFTDNVRAMVLDGAVNPKDQGIDSILGQAKGFQSAFDAFAASCAAKANCILGQDPQQATAVFQGLVRPLLEDPVKLRDGRVLTFNDAITGTIQSLYSESLWTYLEDGLIGLSRGQGEGLMALADFYESRDANGHYDVGLNALNAVRCVDDATTDDTTGRDINAEYNAAAPFQDSGDPPVSLPSICDFWPAPVTLAAGAPEAPGLAPVVIISTTGDPATPYESGVALADQLGGSLITVEGDRHTAYLSAGISCVDDAATTYLTNLSLPKAGLTCK